MAYTTERNALRADGVRVPVEIDAQRIRIGRQTFHALILHKTGGSNIAQPRRETDELSQAAQALAVRGHQASEVEKRRFSRELYDDIGQRLSVLKLDLSWLESRLSGTNSFVPARLAQMQGMLDKVISLTKNMASTLRPPVLDDFGLLPALEWMVQSFRKRTAVECGLNAIGLEERLDEPLVSAVFRVVQEALANIEQHAQAKRVWISIRRRPGQLLLSIRDDGKGVDIGSRVKAGCGGLAMMQERVFVLGGTIRIENARPQGVQIRACIPLDAPFP